MQKKLIYIFLKIVFLIGILFTKNLYASYVDAIQEQIKIIEEKGEKLNALIAENEKFNLEVEEILIKISKNSNKEISSLTANYSIITSKWRALVDKSFYFSKLKKEIKVFRPEILDKEFTKDEEVLLQKKLQKDFIKFDEKYQFFKFEIRNNQLALLSRVGKQRAQILGEILNKDADFITRDNQFYFSDLYREIRLIPYRPSIFFYDKLVGYQELLKSGATGLVKISAQIFWFLIFIISLGFASKIFRKLSDSLNKFRSRLIKISIENSERSKSLIVFLPKIIPYFSWMVLLVIIDVLYVLLSQTALADVAIILPFFAYYFIYRILKIFISSFLNQNISAVSFGENFSRKVEATAQFFGRFFLVSMWILLLTENIVRKALFYHIVLQVFIIGSVIVFAYLASLWREEVIALAQKYFDEKLIDKIKKIKNKKLAIIYSLPLLIIVVFVKILHKLLNILSKNDLIKTLSSQIYRKKLEVAAKKIDKVDEINELPQDYLKNFSADNEDFIEVKAHSYHKIRKNIESWFDEKLMENSLVIYGKSGMGKSKILQRLHQDFSAKELKIINYKISEKITKKEELENLIQQIFCLQKENCESAFALENVNEKTLVLLDDCHNLFLSKRLGLEGFKRFASLVNSSSGNIFWVCTFDNFAWNYLYNALEISKYFRYSFKIPRWRDVDIKNLILTKHNNSGFKMIYDPLIFAIHTQSSREEFEDINQKFFQMLWGQSKGNPRLAMMLWLSCLSLIDKKTLKINLPKATNQSQLLDLPDEQFFIYASIAKHHNLNLENIVASVNVSYASALNAVRIGIEKGYLVKNNDCYLLSLAWQNEISQLLINKNFIYE